MMNEKMKEAFCDWCKGEYGDALIQEHSEARRGAEWMLSYLMKTQEPFAWCFTDVNGEPTEFCDDPVHRSEEDKRIYTPLYKDPVPKYIPEGYVLVPVDLPLDVVDVVEREYDRFAADAIGLRLPFDDAWKVALGSLTQFKEK